MSDPLTKVLIRCPHLGDKILLGLDIKSIMQVKAVSTDMYIFVKKSRKVWIMILRRFCKKYCLVHPLWVEIQQKFHWTDFPELCQEIMDYKWHNYR